MSEVSLPDRRAVFPRELTYVGRQLVVIKRREGVQYGVEGLRSWLLSRLQRTGGQVVKICGVVQRMRREGAGMPFMEYRTRDAESLLSETEWGWSRDRDDAYVFPMYELPLVSGDDDAARSAEFHAKALKEAGETGWVCACVFGSAQFRERELRHASAEVSMLASVEAIAPVMPEPEFEEGGRPPIRRGDKIQERIRKARRRKPGSRPSVDPAVVFEQNEKRHLA